MRGALVLVAALAGAGAHMSMVIPTPRNAIDGVNVPEMAGGGKVSGGLTCTCADSQNCPMGAARAVGGAGQPCLWWSQGCSIGCPYCMTDPRHPKNNGSIPTAEITGNAPHADKAGFRRSYCDNPSTRSVLPKPYWTMNVHAADGAVNDSYRFNPWRAPGTAPVVDPCGQAGGKFSETPMGGASNFGTVEVSRGWLGNLTLQMGDMGSAVLPPLGADGRSDPAQMGAVTQWRAGSTPRVAWGMRFNHGGGYQYRLCPLEQMPCSEADYQKLPLDFVRSSHAIMWNNGTLRPIEGKFVDDTVCPVVPAGSTWARNPIPRIHTDNVGMAFMGKCLPQSPNPAEVGSNATCTQLDGNGKQTAPWCGAKEDCQQFPSPCPGLDAGWYGPDGNATHMATGSFLPDSNQHEGWCSGDWTLGMVSDELVVPAGLRPGRYVLSWRMDCEETAQVWSSCADVEIVASNATAP